MRILSVHNYYQIRGGEDVSTEAEVQLLRDRGHTVDTYNTLNQEVDQFSRAQLALRTVWSQETYRNVRKKLQQSPADIVHIQNFFPLISPSVCYAAQAEGARVVQSLRNYRLVCPNGLFFRQGQVCEDCMGKVIPYPGVVHGCYRDSRAASAVTATMLVVHRALKTWLKQVDLFITLSQFAREKFIEAGWSPEKIIVKPNFVDPDPGVGSGSGGYALYVGRLSQEKGLDVLLDAWKELSQPLALKIVGDGPLEDLVTKAAQTMPQVEWLGRKPREEVSDLMGEAMCLIFPSKWYETFGRVAIEAFAKGTPVIASEIGAIAELVDTGETGLRFQPGNPLDLAARVEWLLSHPQQRQAMRQTVRQRFEDKYTAQANYGQLMAIYQQAMAAR
ncbi:MAG: glycosyltransferase [Microcoleaceae cyanobacterium]